MTFKVMIDVLDEDLKELAQPKTYSATAELITQLLIVQILRRLNTISYYAEYPNMECRRD